MNPLSSRVKPSARRGRRACRVRCPAWWQAISLAMLLGAAPVAQAGTKSEAPGEVAGSGEAGQDAAPSRFNIGACISYWHVEELRDFEIDGALGGSVIGQFRLADFIALELRLSGYATGDSQKFEVAGRRYRNDLTFVALPLEAGLVLSLPLGRMFSLYGGPGIGYYLFDGQYRNEQGPHTTIYDIEVDDEPGGYVLLGLRAQAARRLALFLEGKYTWVETSVSPDIATLRERGVQWASQDMDCDGVALNAGMIFSF